MELPHGNEGLRDLILQQSARFAATIAEAERRRQQLLRERQAVLQQGLAELEPLACRLAELGEHLAAGQARDLVEALQREAALVQRQSAGGNPMEEAPPVHTETSGTVALPVALPPVSAPPVAEPPAEPMVADHVSSTATPSMKELNPPIPVQVPAGLILDGFDKDAVETGVVVQIRAYELPKEVDFLIQQAEHLTSASTTELRELHLRAQALVYRALQLQSQHPSLTSGETRLGKEMKTLFGRLTKLAKERLVDSGLFLNGLKIGSHGDWNQLSKTADQELQTHLATKKAEHDREEEQAAQQRRQRQQEEANRKVCEELVLEIEEHCREATDAPAWANELRDLATEAVQYCAREYARLADILAPHAAIFEAGKQFRPLRKQWQKQTPADLSSTSDRMPAISAGTGTRGAPPPRVLAPESEAWRGKLAGKRAAMVGGSCREYRRRQLQDFLGLEELDWVENERTETANGGVMAQRIRNGRYDFVFLLTRFCSHEIQNHLKPACKTAGVPFASVENGYGVNALCAALDACGQYAKGPA